MLSTIKLALAATVAAATGSLALLDDEPAPTAKSDAQINVPLALVSADLVNPLASALATPVQDKRVTVRINGTLDDVVKWLGDTGVSFVLEDKAIASRKLTINLVNQPVEDAIAAIADALGVSWSKRGEVYVFGGQKFMHFAPAAPSSPKAPSGVAPKVWSWSPKDGDQITIDVQKAIEQARKAQKDAKGIAPKVFTFEVPGHPMSPKDQQEFELHMKQLGEHMKALPHDVKVFTDLKPMSEKEQKAFEESMKKLHEGLKVLPKSFEGTKMSEKERKELELEMKKLHEEMKSLPHDMKVFKWDGKDYKGMSEAERKAFEKSMRDLKVELPKLPKAPVALKSADMKELMKSLTPDQKAKHERQGYLKLSDLNGGQKKMLGNPSGNFTISVNMDGQKLTIKNP